MPLIKRYPNRKLYDTEAKRYVTVDELGTLIQSGADVQVIDHESGEDLTNQTLALIIVELQKKSSNPVSRSLLTNLIRSGGDRLEHLFQSLQDGVSSLGTLPNLSEISPAANLHEIEEQAAKLLDQGRSTVQQVQSLLSVDNRMADVLHLFNLPSRRDVQALQTQLDELNQHLAQLIELRQQETDR